MSPASRDRLPRLLVALGATVAGGLVVAPAHAASRTVSDPAGDVAGTVLAPPGSDITRVRAKHTATKVIVTTQLDGLDGTTSSRLLVTIRTPEDRYETTVGLVPGPTDRDLTVTTGKVTCGTLGVGVDTDADTVRVAVPRHCLGHPRWIKVGATVRTEAPGGRHSIIDVALRDGRGDASTKPRLGRKIGPGFQQP